MGNEIHFVGGTRGVNGKSLSRMPTYPGERAPIRHPAVKELGKELSHSEEAVAVWAAATNAGPHARLVMVHEWKVEWKPRPKQGTGGNKKGDLYVSTPEPGRVTCRSLSALYDVLLLREEARASGGAPVWTPPQR